SLIEQDLSGVVPLTRVGSSFDDVIATARRLAQPGDVVLLSPACSSYDMFDNYEHRGATFKDLAAGISASAAGHPSAPEAPRAPPSRRTCANGGELPP